MSVFDILFFYVLYCCYQQKSLSFHAIGKKPKMEKLNFNAVQTFYAPAQRANINIVADQSKSIGNVELIDEVFSKIPLMFQILNKERQIVYINELLRIDLARKGVCDTLGFRPGEMLHCKNAFLEEGGCGTSIHCQYCGIVNSILIAQKTNQLSTQEVIFESDITGQMETTNYIVTSKPFIWQDQSFTIITFENIDDKKRKEQLERTFFHDLMNKVSSISGLSELLEMDESTNENEFVKMIKRGIYDLVDEINFQRNLINAEKDELVINKTELSSLYFLNQMKEDFTAYESIALKKVIIDNTSSDRIFKSDKVLVKRILNNLIKNALEAINQNETVTIGTKYTDDSILFWVQNNKVLPAEIKEKMFKRSFSTKGSGRGIGTYSVKLFTEKYLKGKAYFTSDKENGTIFFIELPL